MERLSSAPESFDIEVPSPSRMYDYALGGSHNFAIDRELVTQASQVMPEIVPHVRAERAWLRRVVGFCVEAGMRQFLNLGLGIPIRGSVSDLVQRAAPEARVVYVDIDPVTVRLGHEILTDDWTGVIRVDQRRPEHILAHPDVRRLFDFDQPVAVLFNALCLVLDDPAWIVAAFRDAVVPGSYLAISHPTTEAGPKVAKILQMLQRDGLALKLRSSAEVERLFAGLELVEPGLVWTHEWRPDPPRGQASDLDRPFVLCGVGRKP